MPSRAPKQITTATGQIGGLLRHARNALGLSQKELAQRIGVSHRLWAEVEHGKRPHVSLATALRMLGEVGIAVRLTDPQSNTQDLGSSRRAAAVRAAVRRASWTGRQIRLDQEGVEPRARLAASRMSAVGAISEQAFALVRISTSRKRRADR